MGVHSFGRIISDDVGRGVTVYNLVSVVIEIFARGRTTALRLGWIEGPADLTSSWRPWRTSLSSKSKVRYGRQPACLRKSSRSMLDGPRISKNKV